MTKRFIFVETHDSTGRVDIVGVAKLATQIATPTLSTQLVFFCVFYSGSFVRNRKCMFVLCLRHEYSLQIRSFISLPFDKTSKSIYYYTKLII